MKFFFLILFLNFGAWAQKPKVKSSPSMMGYIDLFPLQAQLRYEDGSDQVRSSQTYSAYSGAVQYGVYRVQLEFAQRNSASTGNQTLRIEKKYKELNFGAGYRVLLLGEEQGSKGSLSGFANLSIGQGQSEVVTTLYGASATNQSNGDLVVGAGGSVVGRIWYVIGELDFKILYGTNLNPQYVPALGLKIGASIPF